MTVTVTGHANYRWSHGKNPRGFGWWAFKIGSKTLWAVVNRDTKEKTLVADPHDDPCHNGMNFSEATATAKAYARKHSYHFVEVLT